MVLFTNFPPPTEGIRLKLNDTRTFVGSRELGVGCLYIAESRLAWKSNGESGMGFSVEYPAISLHAVSKDLTAFPFECIYLMVDGTFPETDPQEMGAGDMAQEQENSEDEDEVENPISEIRLIPSDKGTLQAMYEALCYCQNLHPDPADSNSDDLDDYEGDGLGDEECEEEEEEGTAAWEGDLSFSGSYGNAEQAVASNGQQGDPVVDPVAKGMENMDVGQFEDAEMDTKKKKQS